jgi:two-component system sensor histidine kinase BaeS
MRSLRTRLILSHVLPVVVIIPLVGMALVYVLETQVMLAGLSEELTNQAELLASMAANQIGIWHDADQARAFVSHLGPAIGAHIMVLDSSGYLIASSNPADSQNPNATIELPGVADALAGETIVRVYRSQYLYAEYVRYTASAEVADVMVPVVGPDQHVMGIIRLTNQISQIHDRVLNVRYVTLAVLLAALLLSVGVGWLLALNLGRPLRQATQAVEGLASGERLAPLPEQGPDEIRQLLHAVNTSESRLHAAEESRRQLLANLVHELGRPLGALRSATQALRGGADRDPALQQELLVGMDDEVGRLQRLLDDLARLYDQALGNLELKYQPIATAEWLAHVLIPWRQAAQTRGLRWQADIPDALPTLPGDPDRLAQALGNLLSNANRYTPSGGTVSVRAGTQNGSVWIEIGDTGPGIGADELATIFEPFHRGRSAGRFPQGMGLGLTIARDLVVAHGGRLDVDSMPGQGSRFTIRLPLDPHQSL